MKKKKLLIIWSQRQRVEEKSNLDAVLTAIIRVKIDQDNSFLQALSAFVCSFLLLAFKFFRPLLHFENC